MTMNEEEGDETPVSDDGEQDGDSVEEEEEEADEEDDDDEGWITPSNIKEKRREIDGRSAEEDEQKHVKVAYMTTDFAMQVRREETHLDVLHCCNDYEFPPSPERSEAARPQRLLSGRPPHQGDEDVEPAVLLLLLRHLRHDQKVLSPVREQDAQTRRRHEKRRRKQRGERSENGGGVRETQRFGAFDSFLNAQ